MNERKVVLRPIAPAATPDVIRETGAVELIGRVYTLTVPANTSEHQRETAYRNLSNAVATAHPNEAWTAIVVPEGWRLEAFEVDA